MRGGTETGAVARQDPPCEPQSLRTSSWFPVACRRRTGLELASCIAGCSSLLGGSAPVSSAGTCPGFGLCSCKAEDPLSAGDRQLARCPGTVPQLAVTAGRRASTGRRCPASRGAHAGFVTQGEGLSRS